MSATDPTARLDQLVADIADRRAVIGVIGLGYVGLPLACVVADAGFGVIGVDLDEERLATIAAGRCPIEGDEPGLGELLERVVTGKRLRVASDYQSLAEADLVTLNVDTPVGDDHRPGYEALRGAVRSLGPVLKPGAIVVVESTVSPGTTRDLVAPLLEESTGGVAGTDFHVGACPERVMPGKLLANLRTMARVCGGSTPPVSAAMRTFYECFVEGEIDIADPTTAEMVKVVENSYRDVQIAFANEVALVCAEVGIDVWRVRDLVNKVPFRSMHLPGGGVGGHCIPKDPWLLAAAAPDSLPLHVIPAARAVNDAMPRHVADETFERLGDVDRPSVAVLGYSYLPESDDTRNSPSATLVAELERRGAVVRVHDPFVAGYDGPVDATLEGVDAVVLMVPHKFYDGLTSDAPVFVDARHLLDEPQESP